MNSVDAATDSGTGERVGRRIAGAAALIAGLTVLSRIAGFGRTMVFAWAVGANDLGDVYFVANLIPNLVFEIVAGGALASLVVPMLAGPVATGDRAAVARTTSALLTWVLTGLVPLAALLAFAAPWVISVLDSTATSTEVAVGAQMLRIFAPQLPLYGVGIVLTGLLQAHRRFAWPVLAPLLSSITVTATYLVFAAVAGRGVGLDGLSPAGLLVLAGGTTAGVVVLAGCLVPPVCRLRVGFRPRWRLDLAARRRIGALAAAGAVTVAAQHLALAVVVWRGKAGPEGTWVLFTLAQTLFLLPWAVLAVPVATAAYPSLAEAAATGNDDQYRATLATTLRTVLLLSSLGTAALMALADPVSLVLTLVMPGGDPAVSGALATGLVGFAPGLEGYGLFAVLSRALYARGETRVAALAAVVGWAVVAAAAVVLSVVLMESQRVVALTAAHSIGLTVLGAALLAAVAAAAGRAALAGVGRTTAAAAGAALLAAAAGWVVAGLIDAPPSIGSAIGSGMLAAAAVVAVFLAVVWLLDRGAVAPTVSAMWARVRRGTGRGGVPQDRRGVDDEEARG